MSDKMDVVLLAHKALDAALESARQNGQTGQVGVTVNVHGGTPHGTPKVTTDLTARTR